METVILVLQTPFLIVAILLSSYLVLLTVSPFVIPKHKKHVPKKNRKFAIVIPAHNEEKVIENTLRSAFAISYPRDLFDVIVVADNSTDKTAKLALAAGAIVFQRFDTMKRGKGYALNWIIPQVLERLPAPGYDACVFVDADSVISANFLSEMNTSLDEGHRIIQSSDLVLDNANSWRVQLMLIAFSLQNYVRPLGKAYLGLSVPLKGNGMCFSADLLRTMKWDEASLGEDLDMGMELIRQGEKIHFNPEPVVYAIMPEDASSARTQRIRWEGGRFASMKHRVPLVLKEAWKRKSLYIFEAAIDAAFPPLALLLLVTTMFVVVNALFVSWGIITSGWMMWAWLSVIGMITVHCILGLILARVHPRNLLAFLYLPRYLIWKIGVYLSMFAGKTNKIWVRTER
jgi:cellulose synthase/poly-beta-1,6-N-acetylglucosamine synthase-like glycosyltransferase